MASLSGNEEEDVELRVNMIEVRVGSETNKCEQMEIMMKVEMVRRQVMNKGVEGQRRTVIERSKQIEDKI